MALSKSNIRVNKSTEPTKDLRVNKSTEHAKDLLIMAVDLIDNRDNADYLSILNSHTESLRAKHSINYKPEGLDDFLYLLAKEMWPHVTFEISDRINAT